MGNCQAIDAVSSVVQHPSGRVERLYWPVTANEIMRMNKGHYVALVINFVSSKDVEKNEINAQTEGVNITRVKLLRPTDTLVLGQSYRLITSEEVMKGLWAKKYAKTKKKEAEMTYTEHQMNEKQDSGCEIEPRISESEKINQPTKHERQRQRASSALAKSRTWRPSLHSISEATS